MLESGFRHVGSVVIKQRSNLEIVYHEDLMLKMIYFEPIQEMPFVPITLIISNNFRNLIKVS